MTFPLVPRGRLLGLSFGTMRSLRRGSGSDVAGSRPYRPGDDRHAIDWAASARLSAARQRDEFVVRERFADEAPRVVVVCDRRPSMSFHRPPLPWLDKARAMRVAAELIADSTALAGGFLGYLDHADGDAYWEPPRGGRRLRELRSERLPLERWTAPRDALQRALAHLAEHRRSVPAGTFVFVLSDFVPPVAEATWVDALEHGWDLVPVVIQDPAWEQSFPDVGGIVVPLRDPFTGRAAPVRLGARKAAALRRANEERLRGLLAGFEAAGSDAVLLSSAEPADVLASFLAWSELRRSRRAA